MTTGTECVYCGETAEEMHKDHLIPQSRGGSDLPENCVLACNACNMDKSDMTPSEWRPEGLPKSVYERERKLVKKYKMKSRKSRGRVPGSWKFDDRATAALYSIANALQTPNESDSNLESPAGVADGLFEMARAIRFAGRSIARITCAASGCEMQRDYNRHGDPRMKCTWCGRIENESKP